MKEKKIKLVAETQFNIICLYQMHMSKHLQLFS